MDSNELDDGAGGITMGAKITGVALIHGTQDHSFVRYARRCWLIL